MAGQSDDTRRAVTRASVGIDDCRFTACIGPFEYGNGPLGPAAIGKDHVDSVKFVYGQEVLRRPAGPCGKR